METLASAQQEEFMDTELTMSSPDSAKQLVFTDMEVVSSEAFSSTEVSGEDCIATKTSHEVLIIDDDEEEGEQSSSSCSDSSQQPCNPLLSAMTTATTRAEIAALECLIPPVSPARSSIASLPATLGGNKPVFRDPFTLVHRPCKAVIEEAEQLFTDERTKGNNLLGIAIQGLGQFSEKGLSVLKTFSRIISETKHKVAAEARWFSQLNCTPQEVALLQTFLWNRPTNSAVLRFDHKTIDVIYFCDLAEERYIDSFVVDVCISKYIEEV